MGLVEILMRFAGIHSGEDRHAVLMRRMHDLSEKIPAAQELRAAMQRHLCWIVSDDPAGVDDDPLCRAAVSRNPSTRKYRIGQDAFFRDIYLAPAGVTVLYQGRSSGVGADAWPVPGAFAANECRSVVASRMAAEAVFFRKERRLFAEPGESVSAIK